MFATVVLPQAEEAEQMSGPGHTVRSRMGHRSGHLQNSALDQFILPLP